MSNFEYGEVVNFKGEFFTILEIFVVSFKENPREVIIYGLQEFGKEEDELNLLYAKEESVGRLTENQHTMLNLMYR